MYYNKHSLVSGDNKITIISCDEHIDNRGNKLSTSVEIIESRDIDVTYDNVIIGKANIIREGQSIVAKISSSRNLKDKSVINTMIPLVSISIQGGSIIKKIMFKKLEIL